MDPLQKLKDLQAAADSLDTDADKLADLLIVSTQIGEAILSGILLREYELFKNYNEDPATTACEKADFNRSVGELLESACCLEEAFARKLEIALELKRLAAASETPPPASPDPVHED